MTDYFPLVIALIYVGFMIFVAGMVVASALEKVANATREKR